MHNIHTNTQQKESPRFKLIVPEQVNKKFKHLLNRFPSTEWSGTLFYDVVGDYNEVFTATVRDFMLQDIGSAAFTSFQEDENLIAYMIEKDLIDCNRGLCHSHHGMQTFFSTTDMDTLKKEAPNYNHFLSLIVNTAQQYSAKIATQKIQEIDFSGSIVYITFSGAEQKKVFENQKKEEKIIEIITGEVEIQSSPSEVFEELDNTIKELQAKNKIVTYPVYGNSVNHGNNYDYNDNYWDNHQNFRKPVNNGKLFDNFGHSTQQINKNNGKADKKSKANANTPKKLTITFKDEITINRYAKAILHNALLELINSIDPIATLEHQISSIIEPIWGDVDFTNARDSMLKMCNSLEDLLVTQNVDIDVEFPGHLDHEQSEFLEELLDELGIPYSNLIMVGQIEDAIQKEIKNLIGGFDKPVAGSMLLNALKKETV